MFFLTDSSVCSPSTDATDISTAQNRKHSLPIPRLKLTDGLGPLDKTVLAPKPSKSRQPARQETKR